MAAGESWITGQAGLIDYPSNTADVASLHRPRCRLFELDILCCKMGWSTVTEVTATTSGALPFRVTCTGLVVFGSMLYHAARPTLVSHSRDQIMLHRSIPIVIFALVSIAAFQTVEGQDVTQPEFKMVETNGIRLRVATMGDGPLVLLLHGFPSSWYTWRHQIPALAEAGFKVVAPDMRGYGESDKPADVKDYQISQLTADVVGLVDAFGEEQAILIGHDWGGLVGWACMLQYPERFKAYVAMSSPYGGRQQEPLIKTLENAYRDNFFYILYFQEEGVAEAEFDKDPRALLSRVYISPDTPCDPPTLTDPKAGAGGQIPRLGKPRELPSWLKPEDLDYYVDQFTKSGFRGGINYYRNFDHFYELSQKLELEKVSQPVLFIAGARDQNIGGANAEQLAALLAGGTTDLRGVKLFPDVGHWVQQEVPKETNAAILEFLKGLD